jgi:hypothetical protein
MHPLQALHIAEELLGAPSHPLAVDVVEVVLTHAVVDVRHVGDACGREDQAEGVGLLDVPRQAADPPEEFALPEEQEIGFLPGERGAVEVLRLVDPVRVDVDNLRAVAVEEEEDPAEDREERGGARLGDVFQQAIDVHGRVEDL